MFIFKQLFTFFEAGCFCQRLQLIFPTVGPEAKGRYNIDTQISNPVDIVDKASFGSLSLASASVFGDQDFIESSETPTEPRRSPNGYILPDPLPAGLIVTDLRKGRWKIGKSIGLGGFGEIYSAASFNGDSNGFEPENEYFALKVVSS